MKKKKGKNKGMFVIGFTISFFFYDSLFINKIVESFPVDQISINQLTVSVILYCLHMICSVSYYDIINNPV